MKAPGRGARSAVLGRRHRLGRIVYATSTEQYGAWLADMGISATGPVLPLAIPDVAPGIPVAGPAPELAEQVRDLHRRFRSG